MGADKLPIQQQNKDVNGQVDFNRTCDFVARGWGAHGLSQPQTGLRCTHQSCLYFRPMVYTQAQGLEQSVMRPELGLCMTGHSAKNLTHGIEHLRSCKFQDSAIAMKIDQISMGLWFKPMGYLIRLWVRDMAPAKKKNKIVAYALNPYQLNFPLFIFFFFWVFVGENSSLYSIML